MAQNPLVSILMPVKNASPWLDECLSSIVKQGFTNWELMAVDDGSEDDSFEMLQTWSLKDDRIVYVQNNSHGIIPALRMALKNASAPFITRMDADDIMPKHKLSTFIELAKENPDSIVTGKVEYFSDGQISPGYQDYEHWLNERCVKNDHWDWVYRECVIASANWLAPRSLVSFDRDVYPEDYDLVFQWYAQKAPVMACNEVTHLWREHPERTSRNSDHYQQKAFFDLKLAKFLELDYDSNRPLVIMGTNKKAKLCSHFFGLQNILHALIGLADLAVFDILKQPQVLVAVFPSEREQIAITKFLNDHGLEMSKDWWWV